MVHSSVDKLAAEHVAFPFPKPKTSGEDAGEESEGGPYIEEEGDRDRVLKGCRHATAEDGLFTDDELRALFTDAPLLRSAYGRNYGRLDAEHAQFFRDRPDDQRPGGWAEFGMLEDVADEDKLRRGDCEPLYTSVTPIWRCVRRSLATRLTRQTLDYIFTSEEVHVDGLLPIHRIEELEGGLPRANVGPSDHMGLMVRALPP